MAIRTREELMQRLSEYIGEDNSDNALELMEDVTDTYDSLSDGEDWKAKYDELDASWRERYRERFRSGSDGSGSDVLPTGEKADEGTHEDVKDEDKEIVTYEDFFESIEVEE